MKALQEKINQLDKTIVEVLDLLQRVKKQNSTLTEENQRLTYNINQLSKNRGEDVAVKATSERSEAGVISDREIDIKLIREELDTCIKELETYIGTSNNNG